MTRQLVCPVLSRSSLKQQHKAKTKQDDREVPSKKVVVPKPGIPPARIPEIASRSRAGMTSTDAHRSPRYAELCEKRGGETKVKRGSRGAPFGEGTLSPLRRYLKPLPKGGQGGGGGGVSEEPKPP